MNEQQQSEKPMTNEEVDEASELELSDRVQFEKEKTKEKYQIEIKGELVDLFEDGYFKKLDEIDELTDGTIEKEDKNFKERFDFDMSNLRKYIDAVIPDIMGKINVLSKKGEINIISENSLRDVLSNSLINSVVTVLWFRNNMNERRFADKINDPKSGRRKSLDNAEKLLSSENLSYYFRELCLNESKLKAEVGLEYGYLSNFLKYFRDVEKMKGVMGKNYPSGSKKLPYFRFFSELKKLKNGEKSEINTRNFEEKLKELDDEFVDKDEIRKDFFKK